MSVILTNYSEGQVTNRTAFNIPDGAFPNLINAYQWRGRIKRKRGTELLGRLTYVVSTTSIGNSSASPWTLNTLFSLASITQGDASLVPGTVIITIGTTVFTDQGDGTLTSPTAGNSGTINYSTGVIVLTTTEAAGTATTAEFHYYPNLPVMGLETMANNLPSAGATLGFDTLYSYNISNAYPFTIYNTNFYKNPTASAPNDYPSYVPKTTHTSLHWNGENYQQFFTTNYEGTLWSTNGINVPFDTTNIGMQFQTPSSATQITATTVDFVIASCPLVVGDFVFANEFTGAGGSSLNFQTGYVTAVNTGTNTYTVKFPYANITATLTPGILQYLTTKSTATKDCLMWYDGDPTSGSSLGWVNFAPPLSQAAFSIGEQKPAQYYLVGARVIFPFKDRILFFGPVIQTSSAGSQIYLQDTIIYSQNGTPYYTASFTGDVDLATTQFNPILTPENTNTSTIRTAAANAYFCDQTGYGGFITAGLDQPILTVSNNEDVLIVGFADKQARLIYTSNDILPFNLYVINSELGSGSTFSAINLDKGVISLGNHGITLTSQTGSQRIDLDIPDQIFQFNLNNNGFERVCTQRDFINEWIYLTYCANNVNEDYLFPSRTLQYNYRDDTWGVFNETYTTYGTIRKTAGSFTWATVGTVFPTWDVWNEPWNAGSSTIYQPEVIAGNQQGFILVRDVGTSEAPSLEVENIVGGLVTSPNHCLNGGDYITFTGALGTVSSAINGKVFSVIEVDADTFLLNPTPASGTYLGAGVITRFYVPMIQTKQFPISWQSMRQTRIGVQQYLFTTTASGQVTINIYLNNDGNIDAAWNSPLNNPSPNSLIYSQIVYTCPESTNLGLTRANVSLQQQLPPDAPQQTWHRINTSMIGYTVQIGVTLSDAQMRDPSLTLQTSEIELHAMTFNLYPSMLLA